MTPRQASKIIKEDLARRGIAFAKVSARTVGFVDLARDSKVFVSIEGMQATNEQKREIYPQLKELAKQNGFLIS